MAFAINNFDWFEDLMVIIDNIQNKLDFNNLLIVENV